MHNLVIISKIKNPGEALYYVQKTMENNWSRAVLTHHIESRLYERDGKAITNFHATLPAPQSDLARETLKDPYNFDFLTLSEKHDERELEAALVNHVTRFLLELGAGFSFIGRQYRLEVAGDEFFIDLLFYHMRLHCYKDIHKPMGVSEYTITRNLPEELKSFLPSIEEIEAELEGVGHGEGEN